MKGTVLFYNRQRGWGFIAPLAGEPTSDVDFFFHVSGLINRKSVQANDGVEFELSTHHEKPVAINVRVIAPAAPATNGGAK
jgi:cold shock CspA family protein